MSEKLTNEHRPGVLFGYLTKEYRGGVKFQLDFAQAFQQLRVGFITSNTEVAYEDRVKRLGAIHRIPPTKHLMQRIQALRKLAKEYDILYLNKATLNPFEMIVVQAAGFRKVVFHSHSTGKDCGNPLVKAAWYAMHYLSRGYAAHIADKLYACSPEAGRWLYGERRMDRVTVIPNGVDVNAYRFDPDMRKKMRQALSLKGFTIIHVGVFSPVKNQGYLAEAFACVHASYPDSRLLLVGDGPLRDSVQSRVRELGIEEAVQFLGQRDDVAQLLQAADVFVLPSTTEGLPFSAVEAQAAGLPCILTAAASPVSGILSSCRFFDVSRPAASLAEQIQETMAYERTDQAERLAEAGFDVGSSAAKLEEQLLELLSDTKEIK